MGGWAALGIRHHWEFREITAAWMTVEVRTVFEVAIPGDNMSPNAYFVPNPATPGRAIVIDRRSRFHKSPDDMAFN
jgi:hypothetical protein